jgi:hypothetical protein
MGIQEVYDEVERLIRSKEKNGKDDGGEQGTVGSVEEQKETLTIVKMSH